MAGNIKVGGHTVFTHTGPSGAGTLSVQGQNGNVLLSDDGTAVSLGNNVRLPATGGIKDSSGNDVLTESGGNVSISKGTVGSSVVFPAGHVIQTKVIKDSTARGGFGSQGDTYTGVSITFDNNLSSTNSVVLIEASLQIDVQNDTGYGFTWGASSTTLSGNKIGVEGSTITNFSRGSLPYINASRHGDHVSFITCDSNIISVTPKTYYLWVINSHFTNIYINTHTNVNQGQQFATNFWTGSSTAVYKLTEIAG